MAYVHRVWTITFHFVAFFSPRGNYGTNGDKKAVYGRPPPLTPLMRSLSVASAPARVKHVKATTPLRKK